MIIKHAHIDKFRSLQDVDFDLGSKITAIVGHNGTMKTTVLGILSQTFTIGNDCVMNGSKTIDGYNYHSQFQEKFKLSEKDIPGEHLWRLDLYPGIYKNDYFEAHSIKRDKTATIPRFWSTEGKGKGTGYPQVPVYYISLKRVTPIGEEKKFNYIAELEDEEKEFLFKEYKEIFAVTSDSELVIDAIQSSNKHTASVHNSDHDALAISAGQDNLGKLLIAVLSFKRLKDKFQGDYFGGIILIDELESTLHPASQARLVKRLYKYAKDYKIQFVFTTHSPTVIKEAFFDNHNKKEAQLLYLKKVGDRVLGYNNPEIDYVVAELNGEVVRTPKKTNVRVKVFTEDKVGRQMVTNWLSQYKGRIDFVNCSIGAENYLELLRVKLEPLTKAVIILDGDKNNKNINNKLEKYRLKNVLFLPGEGCPEKLFYQFLYNLPGDDEFWDNELGGYDKEKCFSNYATLLSSGADANSYKKWFEKNEKYWGRTNKKLYDCWKKKEPEAYDRFIKKFIDRYNRMALLVDAEMIV